MGGEEIRGRARIVDAHLHDAGRHPVELSPAVDLEQRGDERIGFLREFHRARIGQERAGAHEGEADHDGQEPGERDAGGERDGDRRERRPAAPAPRRARGPAGPAHAAQAADHELGHEGDDAGDDDRHDDHPDVVVADMRELVREHRLDFVLVEGVDEAAGQGNRVLLGIEAGRESVQRGRLHHLEQREPPCRAKCKGPPAPCGTRGCSARSISCDPVTRSDDALVEPIGEGDPGERSERATGSHQRRSRAAAAR